MKVLNLCLLGFIVSYTTGCATILSGRTQTVTLETNPSGARCELVREGRIIGSVENTPGAVSLQKTKHDIDVVCKKEGYGDSKAFAESGTEGATFGNIILGGLVGWGIDSAVGADNKYPENIVINLAAPEKQPPTTNSQEALALPRDQLKGKLETLEQLRKDKVLTEEEYKRKRAEIVSSL